MWDGAQTKVQFHKRNNEVESVGTLITTFWVQSRKNHAPAKRFGWFRRTLVMEASRVYGGNSAKSTLKKCRITNLVSKLPSRYHGTYRYSAARHLCYLVPHKTENHGIVSAAPVSDRPCIAAHRTFLFVAVRVALAAKELWWYWYHSIPWYHQLTTSESEFMKSSAYELGHLVY